MIKKFYSVLKYNILILFGFIVIFYFVVSFLNLIISGQPRYWEIVHGKNLKNLRTNKEKIIQLKKNKSNRSKFLNVMEKEYRDLSYSGPIIKDECGSIENGYDNLIYQTDKNGFRENIDFRYIYSDYVLLGDSFTKSICENKPNDLKSLLLKNTNNTYLNLGFHGTDYAEQFLILSKFADLTEFKGLIWFFYEGNDYEQKSFQINQNNNYFEKLKNKISNDITYEISIKHNISYNFKFRVWLAEFIRAPSVLIKFFKRYNNLLDKNDYETVLKETKKFLDKKNTGTRIIIYIPSWQKLSLYKLRKLKIYDIHPQVKQFNSLKLEVKKIAEKYNFKFVDADDHFFSLKNPLESFYYELNTHFNKKGNEVLSNIVKENLY